MTEQERLACIKLAVDYAYTAREMGMPKAAWSKAVREPIFFLWEKWGKKKHEAAQYRSAVIHGCIDSSAGLVYDHAYPVNQLIDELLASDRTTESIQDLLESRLIAVLITPEQDRLLAQNGLRSALPKGCQPNEWQKRYEAVGIELVRNQRSRKEDETND